MATYGDASWCETELAAIATDRAAIRTALTTVTTTPADYTDIQIGQVKKSRGSWIKELNSWLKSLDERERWVMELYGSQPLERQEYFDLGRDSRADDGIIFGRRE